MGDGYEDEDVAYEQGFVEGKKQGALEELKELLKYSDCSQVDKKCIILKIKNRIKEAWKGEGERMSLCKNCNYSKRHPELNLVFCSEGLKHWNRKTGKPESKCMFCDCEKPEEKKKVKEWVGGFC